MPYLADRSSDLPLEKTVPYTQHNAFLALLVETGLLGMGLFILLLILWVRNAWRLCSDDHASPVAKQTGILFLTLIGAYLPNALFQNTSIIDGLNLLLFFVAGTVSGLAAGAVHSQQSRIASREHLDREKPELLLQSI
jgi:O-antigen ligase